MKNKLYAFYCVKGKQNFHIGDNLLDHLEYKGEFKEYRKLLDWETDFTYEFRDAGFVIKLREGAFGDRPKTEKELINHCIVICTSRGIIKGIMKINKNNMEELHNGTN